MCCFMWLVTKFSLLKLVRFFNPMAVSLSLVLNTILDKAESYLNYSLSVGAFSINIPLLLQPNAIITANRRGQWHAMQGKPV